MIVTYIPPHNSPHADITRFDVLENTINEWLTDNMHGNVCIVGDFNARTGTLNDTLGVPDYADSFLDGPDTDVVYSNTTNTRANGDKTVNKFGSRLIELCKSLNMYIANGRCGNDKDVGSPTSKGISTVDYVVVTESLLNKIVHFLIEPFDPMFSDIHSPVAFTLYIRRQNTDSSDNEEIRGEEYIKKTVNFQDRNGKMN